MSSLLLVKAEAGWRDAAGWLATPPSRRFCVVVFGLYALHVVTGLAAHAMWRDELQAWLIVRDSATLPQLVQNLAYEGHPIGWYLLAWPLRLFGRDPRLIQVAQAACAMGTMGLLLWRGPFSRLEFMLLPLSYPLVFEYAVKSRSYGLGNLLLFAFCASFVARKPALPLAVLLALLVNVHAMFGLIALGGLAAIGVQRWDAGWRHILQRSDLPAIAVLALGAAFAVAVARQPADSGFAVGWAFDLDRAHLQQTATTLGGFISGAVIPSAMVSLSPYVGLALSAVILARASRAPAAVAFFGTAVVSVVTFVHVKYGLAPWHRSLLFIILVAAVWLARGNQGPAGPAVVPRALLLLLLAAQAWTGIREAVTDRVRAYSAARETARVLVKEGLGQAPLFGLRDAAVASVLAYLGAPAAFYGPAMREGSFVIWDQARRDPVNIAAVVDRAEATPGAVVLDCGDVIVDGPPPDPRLVEWRRVVGAVESCIVYRLARRGSDGG